MCSIVVRRCHEYGRIRARRAKHDQALEVEAQAAVRAPQSGTEADTRAALLDAISRLPRRQREVVVLRHLQDMPFEQIGGVLGISAATARVHARAGRESLRKLLAKADPTWFDQYGKKCAARVR